jgi:hypothetical protein
LISLLKVSKFFFISFPNGKLDRAINDKMPENSSSWWKVVDPGVVVLGSKRKQCSPVRRP